MPEEGFGLVNLGEATFAEEVNSGEDTAAGVNERDNDL